MKTNILKSPISKTKKTKPRVDFNARVTTLTDGSILYNNKRYKLYIPDYLTNVTGDISEFDNLSNLKLLYQENKEKSE